MVLKQWFRAPRDSLRQPLRDSFCCSERQSCQLTAVSFVSSCNLVCLFCMLTYSDLGPAYMVQNESPSIISRIDLFWSSQRKMENEHFTRWRQHCLVSSRCSKDICQKLIDTYEVNALNLQLVQQSLGPQSCKIAHCQFTS